MYPSKISLDYLFKWFNLLFLCLGMTVLSWPHKSWFCMPLLHSLANSPPPPTTPPPPPPRYGKPIAQYLGIGRIYARHVSPLGYMMMWVWWCLMRALFSALGCLTGGPGPMGKKKQKVRWCLVDGLKWSTQDQVSSIPHVLSHAPCPPPPPPPRAPYCKHWKCAHCPVLVWRVVLVL